jgi:hypothetical protein
MVNRSPILKLTSFRQRAHLTDHRKVRFPIQHEGEGLAKRRVVIHQQDPNH